MKQRGERRVLAPMEVEYVVEQDGAWYFFKARIKGDTDYLPVMGNTSHKSKSDAIKYGKKAVEQTMERQGRRPVWK